MGGVTICDSVAGWKLNVVVPGYSSSLINQYAFEYCHNRRYPYGVYDYAAVPDLLAPDRLRW